MNHDTTEYTEDLIEHLSNRPNLYERLTPEVMDKLNAMPHPHLREYITELLQAKQYFTEVTVGDMFAILQALDFNPTLQNYVSLFKDYQ